MCYKQYEEKIRQEYWVVSMAYFKLIMINNYKTITSKQRKNCKGEIMELSDR